jgi:hypothetical protein
MSERPFAERFDWNAATVEDRGRCREQMNRAITCWYWIRGPGRQSDKPGDHRARVTAACLARNEGWTDEQLDWFAQNRPRLPAKADKGSSSGGRFDAMSPPGGRSTAQVDSYRLIPQSERPQPCDDETGRRWAGTISQKLRGVFGESAR